MNKDTTLALLEGYAECLALFTGDLTEARQRATLFGIDKPIGVAEYRLLRNLPESRGCNLPKIAEKEAELVGELNTGSEL